MAEAVSQSAEEGRRPVRVRTQPTRPRRTRTRTPARGLGGVVEAEISDVFFHAALVGGAGGVLPIGSVFPVDAARAAGGPASATRAVGAAASAAALSCGCASTAAAAAR